MQAITVLLSPGKNATGEIVNRTHHPDQAFAPDLS